MELKEVIKDAQGILYPPMSISENPTHAQDELRKRLKVLAVKAEMLPNSQSEELIANIDRCVKEIDNGALVGSNSIHKFLESLLFIKNFGNPREKTEYELFEERNAQDDKLADEKEVRDAFKTYLLLKEEYVKKYEELPNIEI